jgi:hypothetical protein
MERGGLRGDSRQEIFERVMRPLASTAEVAVILDRYAADDLMTKGRRSGAAWLAGQLDGQGLPELEIISSVHGRASDPVAVLAAVRSALGDGSTMRLTVRLGAQSLAAGYMHDRHVRFRYGAQRLATAIALGGGTQVFETESLRHPSTIALEGPAVARERENYFRTSSVTQVATWPSPQRV